ncbi:hypothetical protein A9Q84_13780 [Halobacteriovorax marinus]|uniref:Uncharacterized protein n=1 Tax=Halobacteriovorax marinus TaxID=97084 RepID=A0A1Y5FER8_9BACT|nr:hypothetical protein A9Q84_13780 [Halobacteriovorax marinus]
MKKLLIILPLLFSQFTMANCEMDLAQTVSWLNDSFPSDSPFTELSIKSATYLDLGNKCILDKELSNLCSLTHIQSLDLYNDHCSEKLDGTGLKDLLALKNLTSLDLDYNDIELSKLRDLKNISHLKLLGNKLNEKDLSILTELKGLKDLNLADNNLTHKSIKQLKGLTTRFLNLGNNAFSDEDFDGLSKLNILELALAPYSKNNKLEATIGDTFWQELDKMQIHSLGLTIEQASSKIPTNLKLDNLKSISISRGIFSNSNFESFKKYNKITLFIFDFVPFSPRARVKAQSWIINQDSFTKLNLSSFKLDFGIDFLKEIANKKVVNEVTINKSLAERIGHQALFELAKSFEDFKISF